MAGSITVKGGLAAVGAIAKRYKDINANIDKQMAFRMKQSIRMVYTVAHQKRPYISQQQAKAQGRRMISKGKYHRVSDPGASAGVPVAMIDGGTLQSSIKTQYRETADKHYGEVYVDAPGSEYGAYLEYGTSKMPARPFMRPAITLVQDALHRLWGKSFF
jgi:HK97 gp10 family phage protein